MEDISDELFIHWAVPPSARRCPIGVFRSWGKTPNKSACSVLEIVTSINRIGDQELESWLRVLGPDVLREVDANLQSDSGLLVEEPLPERSEGNKACARAGGSKKKPSSL